MAKDISAHQPPRHAFGKLIGMHITYVADGVSRGNLEVTEAHFNPGGVLHGGVLFSLADTGMGAALFSQTEKGQAIATIEMKMNFLRPVTQGRVDCETRVLRKGRTTAVMESRLEVDGKLVAIALGTYAIFSQAGDRAVTTAP